jgi:radial spoke head protein 9
MIYSSANTFTRLDHLNRSQDYSTWLELPIATPEQLVSIEKIEGRLLGDPAAEHDVPKEGVFLNNLDGGVEGQKIKEDVRISGIIALINKDVEIVPRKMYYRDANMKICRNEGFKGISFLKVRLRC